MNSDGHFILASKIIWGCERHIIREMSNKYFSKPTYNVFIFVRLCGFIFYVNVVNHPQDSMNYFLKSTPRYWCCCYLFPSKMLMTRIIGMEQTFGVWPFFHIYIIRTVSRRESRKKNSWKRINQFHDFFSWIYINVISHLEDKLPVSLRLWLCVWLSPNSSRLCFEKRW